MYGIISIWVVDPLIVDVIRRLILPSALRQSTQKRATKVYNGINRHCQCFHSLAFLASFRPVGVFANFNALCSRLCVKEESL
jgi:hypothetical protein